MTAPRVIRPAAADRATCPCCYAGVVAGYDDDGVPVWRDCEFCSGLGTVPTAALQPREET